MRTIGTVLIAFVALTFAMPGKAAAQSVLEQKLDKIITVLEKGQQANEARFRSIETRLAQVEQRGSYTPPAPTSYSGYTPAKAPTSYAPGYAPPPGLTPCYTLPPAPAGFTPLAGSPLSPAEQVTLIEYFDRVTNRGGDPGMTPAEQEAMSKLVRLTGR